MRISENNLSTKEFLAPLSAIEPIYAIVVGPGPYANDAKDLEFYYRLSRFASHKAYCTPVLITYGAGIQNAYDRGWVSDLHIDTEGYRGKVAAGRMAVRSEVQDRCLHEGPTLTMIPSVFPAEMTGFDIAIALLKLLAVARISLVGVNLLDGTTGAMGTFLRYLQEFRPRHIKTNRFRGDFYLENQNWQDVKTIPDKVISIYHKVRRCGRAIRWRTSGGLEALGHPGYLERRGRGPGNDDYELRQMMLMQ